MFSTARHKKYQADLEKVSHYNQRVLHGQELANWEKLEHLILIAEWKAYEETLNYKFFLMLGYIRRSHAMGFYLHHKRQIGEYLWCIGYDIRQMFKKKA